MKIGILAIQGSVIEHKQVLERLGITVQEVRLPGDIKDISGIILPGGESTTQSQLLQDFGLFGVLKKAIENGLPVWGTCAGAILLAKEIQGKHILKALEVMDIVANRNWYGRQRDSFICELDVYFSGIEESRKSKVERKEKGEGKSERGEEREERGEVGVHQTMAGSRKEEAVNYELRITDEAASQKSKNEEFRTQKEEKFTNYELRIMNEKEIINSKLPTSDSRLPTCTIEGVFIRAPKLESSNAKVHILAEHDSVPVMLQQNNMLVTAFHPELTDDTRVHDYFISLCR